MTELTLNPEDAMKNTVFEKLTESSGPLFVGLDVHKEKITVGLADDGRNGEVRLYGSIDNTSAGLNKLISKLGQTGRALHFCYEAGGCGYKIYHQIIAAGLCCDVIAPSRIPKAAGDRIKTDHRDALMLAKLLRSNELTPIWVPDLEHEAMRDLIRSRAVALKHFTMARQQLQAFLLRHGRTYAGRSPWTRAHFRWLGEQKFEQPAQQIVFQDYINAILDTKERLKRTEHQIDELLPTWSLKPVLDAISTLKGVNTVVGATLLASTGDLTRFATPQQLMSYLGLVPSEHSSGGTICRGGITKTGNNEARRTLIQAAWTYRFPVRVGPRSLAAFKETTKDVRDIAWKAQQRLTKRYRALACRGKPMQVVATAIARELLGFIWAIGQVTKPA